MCRIVAYCGPPLRLSALLTEAPHSLRHQSRAAREMGGSAVAGDGWGVGWFADPEAAPGLLKSARPLWLDENAETAPRAIVAETVVGHVRLASGGVETSFANTPIYALDGHLWTVNGELSPWPGPLAKALRDRLDPDHEAEVRGVTDGELLGALWRTAFRRLGDAAGALRWALRVARDLAAAYGGEIKANVLLAGPGEVLAARFAEPGPPPSLYTLAGQDRWPGGVLVASEPLDGGHGWEEVPPGTLVRIGRRRIATGALDLDGIAIADDRGAGPRPADLLPKAG